MSIENARAFYQKIMVDQSLQQKIGQVAKENPQGLTAVIIKNAKENGLEFTETEMKTFFREEAKKMNPAGELGEVELESVAGGSKPEWIYNSIGSFGISCAISAGCREVGECTLDD